MVNVSQNVTKEKNSTKGKRGLIFEYLIDLETTSFKLKDIANHVSLSTRQVQRYLTNKFWDKVLIARRRQYSKLGAKIDLGLIKKAAMGHAPEVKLFYQKFENWKEPKAPQEVTGKGGAPIKIDQVNYDERAKKSKEKLLEELGPLEVDDV